MVNLFPGLEAERSGRVRLCAQLPRARRVAFVTLQRPAAAGRHRVASGIHCARFAHRGRTGPADAVPAVEGRG